MHSGCSWLVNPCAEQPISRIIVREVINHASSKLPLSAPTIVLLHFHCTYYSASENLAARMSQLNHKGTGRTSSHKDIPSQDISYDAASKQLNLTSPQSTLDLRNTKKPWPKGSSQDHNDSSDCPSMLDPPQIDRRRLPNPRSRRGNGSTMPRPDQDGIQERMSSRAALSTGSFAEHTSLDFYTVTLFDAKGSQETSPHGEQSFQRNFPSANPRIPFSSSATAIPSIGEQIPINTRTPLPSSATAKVANREQLPIRKPQTCYRCSLKHKTCNGRKPSCNICIKDAKECKYPPRKFYSCDQCLKGNNQQYPCDKEKPKCNMCISRMRECTYTHANEIWGADPDPNSDQEDDSDMLPPRPVPPRLLAPAPTPHAPSLYAPSPYALQQSSSQQLPALAPAAIQPGDMSTGEIVKDTIKEEPRGQVPHPKKQKWVLTFPYRGIKATYLREACKTFLLPMESRKDASNNMIAKVEKHMNANQLGLSPDGLRYGKMVTK